MSPVLPARCTRCGHVFVPSSGGIVIEESIDVTIVGGTTPCPTCGGPAQPLQGRFNVSAGAIEMLEGPAWSWDVVQQLRLTLRRVVETKPSDPIAEVEAVVPALGHDLRRLTSGWTSERIIALISGILGILSFAGVNADNSTAAVSGLMHTVAEYVAQHTSPGM